MIDSSVGLPAELLVTAIEGALEFFRRKKREKIPLKHLFRRIERRYNIKLSGNSKNDILCNLKEKGNINILEDTDGEKYIIFGQLDI